MPTNKERLVNRRIQRRTTLEGCQGCFGSLAVALIFLLVGGGLSYWGWTILQDARASMSWPTAEGVIGRSEVTESSDSEGGTSYSPEVTYTYQANGLLQEGERIKFGENSYSSRRRAEEIIAQYPVGTRVTVHYDPEQPDHSVLEPGVTGGSYIVLGIGLIFLFVSAILVPIIFVANMRG
jgi:hypothetical protein